MDNSFIDCQPANRKQDFSIRVTGSPDKDLADFMGLNP